MIGDDNDTSISIITAKHDPELARIESTIDGAIVVDGRGDLEATLGLLLRQPVPETPRTLDLIGHSSADQFLLLGDWPVDAMRPAVRALFRGLADEEVLPRLGVCTLRLLGCQTASSEQGRRTLCMLREILGVEVFGTTQMIFAAHYNQQGFRADLGHVLLAASDVDRREPTVHASPNMDMPKDSSRRRFDLEMLVASPLSALPHAWPRKRVDLATGRAVVQLLQRGDGAQMPGLLAAPICEVALPAVDKREHYYCLQVLLGYQFVRVYPEGSHRPGIVYPVEHPDTLRALLAIY